MSARGKMQMTKVPNNKGATRKSLLSGVSIAAAVAAALAGASAHAQEEEEAIVVTGSRIPQPNLVTTSPVTQLTAEDITSQGATRVEDMTNELPQVFGAQSSNLANSANGTATVDLRGLGAKRTLVLINGRRMGYGALEDSAADLNQIPGALVERVEVLTGGASAVYGSDAIAGVVNFIMRDDFEGVRLDAQYGFYNHSNDSEDGYIREVIAARGLTNPSQFQLPADDVNTGYGQEITTVFGASTSDGRGNVTAYLGFRNDDAVLQRDFDYSACSLAPDSTAAVPGVPAGAQHWRCGGSGTTSPARITAPTGFGGSGADVTPRGPADAFIPYDTSPGGVHAYNFGPINYFQRPAERYSLGAFARYEINQNIEAYSQLMFSHQTSLAQIAPSGAFYGTFDINCGDPNLGATRAGQLGCTPGQISGDQNLTVLIGRRNTEGGGRVDDRNYESYRGTIGIRGPINESWDYDLYAQYGSVRVDQVYRNDFSTSRLNRALDVVDPGLDGAFFDDPATVADETLDNAAGGGAPICRSADPSAPQADTNCVPYNVWNTGGVTDAALAYLSIPGVRTGEVTQQIVSGAMTGDLGFGSPAAETPFQAAFGFEYRRDEIGTDVDTVFSTGDLSGQGGPTFGVAGDIDVFELFAEARLPLIEDGAFAELLSVDMAYRYSDYSNGTTTDTYKIGGEWAPTEDIRLRGSYQQAVRAPNIIELFYPAGLGLFDMGDDPCDAADPNADGAAPQAACVGANPWQMTLAQYNSGQATSPAGQYAGFFGGNVDLAPEESQTVTYGFVATPRFLPGFTLSVDYFDIEVTNYIQALDPTTTVQNCYFLSDLPSCQLITREPALGSLFVTGGQVAANNTNLGGVATSGYDINASYSFDIGSAGGLSFSLIGTLLDDLTVDPGPPATPIQCAGTFSASCSQIVGAVNPEWRHRFRVSWETPFEVQLNGTWRYYGEATNNSGTPGDLDYQFDAISYFDLSGDWQVYENTNIRFGVNNVLDQDPPLSDNVGTTGNGNTYPQVYDALGRYIFIGATVDF
jgi:iron complex outermembrane recepter protein